MLFASMQNEFQKVIFNACHTLFISNVKVKKISLVINTCIIFLGTCCSNKSEIHIYV